MRESRDTSEAASEASAGDQGLAVPSSAGERALTVDQVLAWADAHHAAHGAWPAVGPETVSEPVEGAPGETWKATNHALCFGLRGLPGDSSLAELLAEHRGVPLPDMSAKALAEKIWAWEQEQFPVKGPRLRLPQKPRRPSRLTVEEILAWADAHHAAAGEWPTAESGPVRDAPYALTWQAINHALRKGQCGLPPGSTITRLLAEQRNYRPSLSVERILAWADAFHAVHGRWPGYPDRTVAAAPGVSWGAIEKALRVGQRGLPGGHSLGRLLVEHRGPEARPRPARLTIEQILAWADAHHARTGEWPTAKSGAIPEAPADTWGKIELALRQEGRGLSGKTSLARLLAYHRGMRHPRDLPRVTVEQIRTWADAHHAATGRWPTPRSGPIADAPGETWAAMQGALYLGLRGLPAGNTLPQVLADRKPPPRPRLTIELIRTWAEDHERTTGVRPNTSSGPVVGVPGEDWRNINRCLRRGHRGLPGGLRLAQILRRRSTPVIGRKRTPG